MGRPIKKGSTDQSTIIRIVDSTTFLPETGVDYNTSGIDLWFRREGGVKVSLSEAALASLDAAHSDGGIEAVDAGYYRVDLPDSACVVGANSVMVGGSITGMVVIGNEHALVDYDPYDGIRLGLTSLPNAAADAAGGLPISDAGGLDLDTKLANTNEVTAARMSELDAGTAGKMANQVDIIQTDTTTDIPALIATAQLDLDTITGADGATLATAQGNYAPAKAGDLMGLANDAITAAKFDETTAFPLAAADSGATQIARVGADGDTLETLSDQIDLQATVANQTTMINHLTDIKGATFNGATDSLEAIRNQGDSAWTTATGFMPSTEDGSSFTALPAVTLANGAHGGAAATITFKQMVGANSDAGESVVSLTATGTGNSHGVVVNATNGKALALGSTNNEGVSIDSTASNGFHVSGAAGADIIGNITGTLATVTDLTNAPTAGDLTATMKASVNAEVDTALNTAIPASPTAGSMNAYIQQIKFVIKNKMEITEASGDTVVYKDDGATPYCTVLAAFTTDSTTTTRKALA